MKKWELLVLTLALILFVTGCSADSKEGTAFEERWDAVIEERTETLVDVFFCTTTNDSIATVIPTDRQKDSQTAEAVAEILEAADLRLEECTEQLELVQKSKTVGSLSVTLYTEAGHSLGVIITEDDYVFASLADGRLYHAVSEGLFDRIQKLANEHC